MNKNDFLRHVNYPPGGISLAKTRLSLIIVLFALPFFAQQVTAQTKEEIRAWLDGKDGIMPGDIDSIFYTAPEGVWSLAHGNAFQQDGQTVKIFVNRVEIRFDNSLFVAVDDMITVEGVAPGGIDDVYVDEAHANIEGGYPSLALGITHFEADEFDKQTRRPSFQLSLSSSENTEYLYVSWFDKSTNTRKKWSDHVYLEGDFLGVEKNISITGYPFPPSAYGSQLFRVEEVEKSGNTNVYGKIAQVRVPRGGELSCGPNPASTHCTIYYGPDIQGELIIYGMDGDIVYRGEYSGDPLRIDVTCLPAGIYGFQLSTGDGKTPIKDSFGKMLVVR